MRIFGCNDDLLNLQLIVENEEDGYFLISRSFPDVKIELVYKNKIISYVNDVNVTASAAFRKIVHYFIKDPEIWATSNKKSMLKSYENIINAIYDFIKSTKAWPFSQAELEVSRICNEKRRDLKKLGYKFEEIKESGKYVITFRPAVILIDSSESSSNEVENKDENKSSESESSFETNSPKTRKNVVNDDENFD